MTIFTNYIEMEKKEKIWKFFVGIVTVLLVCLVIVHIRSVGTISDPIGSVESAKKRLISMVESAISDAPYFGTASGEWFDLPRSFAQNLPLATVRFGPMTPEDEVYGMILSSSNEDTVKGKLESFSFTVHCFASACKESGEETYRYAHQFTDAIKDYLETHRFENTNYNIFDITDLSQRESMLERAPANVRRVILEGRLWVTKTQDIYYVDRLPFRLA